VEGVLGWKGKPGSTTHQLANDLLPKDERVEPFRVLGMNGMACSLPLDELGVRHLFLSEPDADVFSAARRDHKGEDRGRDEP
jgi:hypothetical protein